MRRISRIVIHCAYTPPGMDVGIDELRRWHTDPKPKGNGWTRVGYHYAIRRDGTVEKGLDESIAGIHAAGFNADSVAVCLIGGELAGAGNQAPDCNFSRHQWRALELLVLELTTKHPGATVCGHRDLNPAKPCPTFDVAAWWGA